MVKKNMRLPDRRKIIQAVEKIKRIKSMEVKNA